MHRDACFLTCVILALCSSLKAQVDNPYHLNGNASQETCNCYTLTPDALFQSGSVWNINKINLSEPFDFKFSLYLGCHDGDGADGIAFVLQPISTSIGAVGGGMGFDGVSPSIGVLVDTWQNYEDNDPAADHISIQKNGIIDHSPASDLADPVSALASGANIEDCQWHTLRIMWDPVLKKISTQMDGVDRLSATIDMIKEIFHGDQMVYWGFTAATGGGKNHQRMCTSLDPAFTFPVGQETCFPQTLQFIDSSTSFGSIEKWFWDFGDGTTSELAAPPPHVYQQPGNYDVKLQILGNNGCLSEPFIKRVVMGTKPVSAFAYAPVPVCEGSPVTFKDASYVEFGNIDSWNWKIGDVVFNSKDPPPMTLTGTTNIELKVETKEGCVGDVVNKNVTAYPVPSADFEADDVCIDEPVIYRGINNDPTVPISQWKWNFDDGAVHSVRSPTHQYSYKQAGVYDIQLTAFNSAGCASLPIVKTIKVHQTSAFAGHDTVIAVNQPYVLNGSGGEKYKWTPSYGLSADDIPNPVATLSMHTSLVLTASTAIGCATTDTVHIKVYKGPAFYVPSAFSPNNDGKNDRFQFIAVGMRTIDLFRIYNRYGQLIYSTTRAMEGWDGKFNGVSQPSGTYVWMISGVDELGTTHFKKGTLTLVR